MIMRVHKNRDYTVMSNHHLRNRNLSLKAKGLMSVMLGLDDGWEYSISGLASICKEGETAVKTALAELKEEGYLKVVKLMPNETDSGRIEYEYDVYEEPIQGGEKQGIENLPLENRPQSNTICINYQEIKDREDRNDKAIPRAECMEPNPFCERLIKSGYLKRSEWCVPEINKALEEALDKWGWDDFIKALGYFSDQQRIRKGKDESGDEIEDKAAYLRKSLEEGVRMMHGR